MPAAHGEVFVDANPLADRHLTGIGRYTARVALALAAERGPVRFFSQGKELIAPHNLEWSQDQDLARWGRRVWRGRRVPLETPPVGSIGLYCCLRPIERTFPFEISVLHDFTPLVVPHTHAEKTRGMFQGFFAKALLSSDAALAVSHSTKSDAYWLTDMPPERIVVRHSGPSLCVTRHLHSRPVRRRPNVGLVVSTLEPRKNAYFLLEWFRNTTVLPTDTELWWVGPLGWLTSRRKLKQYQALKGRRIRFLGVASDARLCELYQTAGWTVYPSLYEGFGFPVLDALRHGAPVLTSYNSSLREFQFPGTWFFDPCDPATLDLAWNEFRKAGPLAIPSAELDAYYDWRIVARTLMDLPGSAREAQASSVTATRAA
jgi:glycosyltransferase involved in cell wall biosynthesis